MAGVEDLFPFLYADPESCVCKNKEKKINLLILQMAALTESETFREVWIQ